MSAERVRLLALVTVLWLGCGSSSDHPGNAPAELCIAENRVEHLAGVEPATQVLSLRLRDIEVSVPNGAVLVRDARGETVRMYRDGENVETIHLDFDHHQTDRLCLYYRPGRTDHAQTPGWKLDRAANEPRCRCWGAAPHGAAEPAPR